MLISGTMQCQLNMYLNCSGGQVECHAQFVFYKSLDLEENGLLVKLCAQIICEQNVNIISSSSNQLQYKTVETWELNVTWLA